MSESRVFIETPCEHGSTGEHWMPTWDRIEPNGTPPECPGGVRRELTIDYEAAVAVRRDWYGGHTHDDETMVKAIVDAALGGTDA